MQHMHWHEFTKSSCNSATPTVSNNPLTIFKKTYPLGQNCIVYRHYAVHKYVEAIAEGLSKQV